MSLDTFLERASRMAEGPLDCPCKQCWEKFESDSLTLIPQLIEMLTVAREGLECACLHRHGTCESVSVQELCGSCKARSKLDEMAGEK